MTKTMKRAVMLVAGFAVISFGWLAVAHLPIGGSKASAPPILTAVKYPPVPTEQEFAQYQVDPAHPERDGVACVTVDVNGTVLGTMDIEGVDFRPGAAPTWAKQAAYAATEQKIIAAYNEKNATNVLQDCAGDAHAEYAKFCDDCNGTDCCVWNCPGHHSVYVCAECNGPIDCWRAKWCCGTQRTGGQCFGHNCGWCDDCGPPDP